MAYRALADLVVLVHLAFVVFVLLGGFLALRWRWLPWLHLPAAFWGAAIEFGGLLCPLTPLEQWLRSSGGAVAYSGGFVEYYILPLIYPPGLSRPLQLLLGLVVVSINLAVYGVVIRRLRRARASSSAR
jgi:hypothetical protein